MTFKYSVTLPIGGANKLRRFQDWADTHLPGLSYSLQPQTRTEIMTVRLLRLEDRARVLQTLAAAPLS